MISIFQYMQAHDEFEIKANKLKQTKLDKYLGNLWIKEVDFTHRGNNIVRRYLLPTLQSAETHSEGILYNSRFVPDIRHEDYYKENGDDLEQYMKIFFLQNWPCTI
uniref:Uncharacterized protein n=1 Tax=Meloidogyne enterolobii TaxID=390850 RepID=A0A6V7VQ34_MELEN|nr:unnamed protein product [Meloidogyne enterolobii]